MSQPKSAVVSPRRSRRRGVWGDFYFFVNRLNLAQPLNRSKYPQGGHASCGRGVTPHSVCGYPPLARSRGHGPCAKVDSFSNVVRCQWGAFSYCGGLAGCVSSSIFDFSSAGVWAVLWRASVSAAGFGCSGASRGSSTSSMNLPFLARLPGKQSGRN